MSTAVVTIFFVAALAAIAGGIWLWTRAQAREQEEEVLLRLRSGGLARDELGASAGSGGRIKNPILRWACFIVWRTGADPEPEKVARGLIAIAVAVPLILLAFGLFAGLVIIGFIATFGYALLARQGARRRAKILQQFPDFLESAMRVLSAGNTLEESLAAAARESPEPIRPLFLSVGRQVRLGAPVEEVLAEMGEIHQLRDLRVLALAASINRRYGGSLRNILRSLVQAVRNRDMAARELRALTAETRFSAWVLALIPIGLTLYILARNPGYYGAMWSEPGGRAILIFSAMLQIAGVLVLWRMLQAVEDTDA